MLGFGEKVLVRLIQVKAYMCTKCRCLSGCRGPTLPKAWPPSLQVILGESLPLESGRAEMQPLWSRLVRQSGAGKNLP